MTVSLEKFLSRLQSDATKKSYKFHILKICGGESAANSLVEKSRADIEEFLIDWINSKKGHLSGYTIKSAIAGLHSFLTENDRTEINWTKIKKHIPKHRVDANVRIPTIDEIRSLLAVCPLREKAQALTLISSGMREGGLAGLLMKDMEDLKGYPVRQLHVYSDSEAQGQDYFTLIDVEAIQAIDQYLDFRKRAGEVLKPASPLFRNDFSTRNKATIHEPTRVNPESISALFNRLWQLSGARVRKETHGGNGGSVRHNFKSVHGFRAFFKTRLESTGMKSVFVEKLMGHLSGLEASYFRPKEEVIEEYVRYMPALYVTEGFVTKNELEQLKSSTVKEVRDYRADLISTQEQLSEMRQDQATKDKAQNELMAKLLAKIEKLEKS